MIEDDKKIFKGFDEIFDVGKDGDKNTQACVSLTVGVVVDTDDPLQMGRLRIFCPSLNDAPEKLQHLPWAAYVSPFGGVVNNSCFTRGSDPSNATTTGAVHYGFLGIPEQGAHALVGCIDGDPRRRFWLGCFMSQQETHTLFTGRFKWSGFDGTPDGPFSSSNDPIQPLYDNLSQMFPDRTAREWKTRGADYQPTAVSQDVGQIPNPDDITYLDEQNNQIRVAEPDQWVKDILGAHGYDWTSFKNLGSFLASKVYGMSTPGGHSISMDDRPFNCRVKVRTTGGHMILMDDTNERIYITTAQGNNYIEMDLAGNIDVFSASRVSVHAANDINFSTEGTFRVKATQGIYMYAGDNVETPLGNTVPPKGQIRLHATDDFHILSDKNIRMTSIEDMLLQSMQDIDVSSINWMQSCQDDFNLTAAEINVVATSQFVAQVGSSSLGINTSDIVSTASDDVYFSGGAISGSINSINATFLTKEDSTGGPMQSASGPSISPPTITVDPALTQIAIWTNRVPQHEPWPRVLEQSSDQPVNAMNTGYQNNVQWVDQFDNVTSPAGLEPIGKVEGNVTIDRGMFWRR